MRLYRRLSSITKLHPRRTSNHIADAQVLSPTLGEASLKKPGAEGAFVLSYADMMLVRRDDVRLGRNRPAESTTVLPLPYHSNCHHSLILISTLQLVGPTSRLLDLDLCSDVILSRLSLATSFFLTLTHQFHACCRLKIYSYSELQLCRRHHFSSCS